MSASDATGSRRIIRVGAPNSSKIPPVYCIPLQTTATINILLGRGAERTNAAGIGTGVPIRTGPYGSEMAPRGILKTAQGQKALSQGQNQLVYGQINNVSTGTLASGEIVPQTAAMVASARPKHLETSDVGVNPNPPVQALADVHISSKDSDIYARTPRVTEAALVASAYNGSNQDEYHLSSHSMQTEGKGNLSDVLANKRLVNNSISTQVQEDELGTVRRPPSYISDSQNKIYSQGSAVASSALGAGNRSSVSGSNVNGEEGVYSSGSRRSADGIYSSGSIHSAGGDPTYSSSSSASTKQNDVDQIALVTAASEKALRATPKRNSSAAASEAGSNKMNGKGDSDIYNKSPGDDTYLDNSADANSFRYIGWEVDPEEDEDLPCQRVLVMKEPDMVLMFTARCATEKVGNDARLHKLMVNIADSCVKRLRIVMKDCTSANIAIESMETLPLGDGRPTKEHLEDLSKELNETVSITDVAFRFQPPDGTYLGTFVQGTVIAKRNYAIGKVGVLAVLTKKSKFATVEAFSEQLCEHIASTRPSNLGTMRGNNTKNMAKSAMAKMQDQQRDQLLLQNFIFDPTIVVAEAARRSFVKIDGFLLFK